MQYDRSVYMWYAFTEQQCQNIVEDGKTKLLTVAIKDDANLTLNVKLVNVD